MPVCPVLFWEIRDGEDRETDNPTPDIYCRLQIPQDTRIIQKLEEKIFKAVRKVS